MKSLLALTRLELFFSLKRSEFYIYYLIMAALLFLFVQVLGGAFPSVQVSGDGIKLNAPQSMQFMMGTVSLLSTFLVSSFAAMAALRDYRYQSYQITFTFPVGRSQYVLGKFLGIYGTNLLLLTAPMLGYAIGCEMPWLKRSLFLPFDLLSYWNIFVQLFVVNGFFLSAIFFTLGLLLRNVVANWIGIIALYVLYYLAGQYFNEANTHTLGALLDPYGLIGAISVRVGQSKDEQNNEPVILQGLYLYNRLLWLGIGFLSLALPLFLFRFNAQKATLRLHLFKTRKIIKNRFVLPLKALPVFTRNFGATFTVKAFLSQLVFDCRQLFKSIYLYIILATGLIFLYFSSNLVGKIFETESYPVTINVLTVFGGTSHIFVILLILVFSGELIWRDAQYRLSGIMGALPASRTIRFLAKTTTLYILVLLVLLLVMLSGIVLQASRGYHVYELSLYIKYLFGYLGAKYLYYCVLAIALQMLVNNRYQGYAVFVLVYIFSQYFAYNIFHLGIFSPGHTSPVAYSNLTGFQDSFYPFYVFLAYWLIAATLLWKAGVKVFPASEGESYKERWQRLLGKNVLKHATLTKILLVSFVLIGGYIFYNTNIRNDNYTQKQINKQQADYEKKYSHLRREAQPSITRVNGTISLLPSAREMQADMELTIVNKNNLPVQNIYLNLPDYENIKDLKSSKAWKQTLNDKDQNFVGYALGKPLQPGDSLVLRYHFIARPKGFTDHGVQSLVSSNGTFLNSTAFLPVIGYSAQGELNGNTLRSQYGLAAKPYAPLMSDSFARQENFFGTGADRIWLKLTISTEKGQTAIAPGYLVKQWNDGGKSYFTYEMDRPAINYFSIQSGKYAVKTERFIVPGDTSEKPVQLSIYYHPGHEYNLGIMMQGMKDALTYYTNAFSSYQYRQLRIVEFPEASFAQSFANTIAFSENIGFLADLRKIKDTGNDSLQKDLPADYTYFVTLHETAHQWWAHQIMPANTEGSAFLSETMSQYSAVMALKKKYGPSGVRKFLEHYSFEYLSSRGAEQLEERPLERVLDQQYIFYAKGMCTMYALQKYIGEDKLNQLLKSFVQDYAFKERPYVTPDMLVKRIKDGVPDSVKYLVSDCLEKIVVYDNHIQSASYKLNPETLEYTIDAVILGKKNVYDEKGRAAEVAMNDYVELGILNGEDKQVSSVIVKLHAGINKVHFVSSRRPASLMLNPDFDLQEKSYDKDDRKMKVTKTN